MQPTTLPAWEAYISELSGQALWSQAVNANTQEFIEVMLDEGMSMPDIQQMLLYFVRQICLTEGRIPEDGAFDLYAMSRQDAMCRTYIQEPLP